ncbi:NAD(P)-binding protein [Vararia minispora EC-137]|uniref:NAD(P)-binding protein n=1 Tax=Vararia minispora EC-137 TaxID=1314806 RepID=A0ACB8QZ76_9AGAM|nr:NAD(P)-binding protein [Vararia minispora EC-137]
MVPGILNRVALVTGAARGIGRGIALRLAADGNDVLLADLQGSPLPSVAKEVESLGRRSHFVYSDITKEAEVKEMVNNAVNKMGNLDIVCGISHVMTTSRSTSIYTSRCMSLASLGEFERVMSINLRGTFLCYRYAGERMVAQGRGGRIVGASSVAGKLGGRNMLAYATSKGGIRSMTQAAAMDLAKHGITVNAYAPGAIDSGMLLASSQLYITRLAPPFQSYAATPVGRIGSTDDIAHLVSYLVSEKASFVTGQTFSCNGGIWCD